MRYGVGLFVASFLLSFWLSPLLFASLGWIFQLPGDIRLYAHSETSARWIGLVQWLLVGMALMNSAEHRLTMRQTLLRWSLIGLLSTLYWTLYLILIDRALLIDARVLSPPVPFGKYLSIYDIPVLEQLCNMVDRFSYSLGLRLMYCDPHWQWRFGSPVLHFVWLLWNVSIVAVFYLCFRVALMAYYGITRRRWVGKAYLPILSGWLAFYLCVPLVELALLEPGGIITGIITTTLYDAVLFLIWCIVWLMTFGRQVVCSD